MGSGTGVSTGLGVLVARGVGVAGRGVLVGPEQGSEYHGAFGFECVCQK